MPGRALRIFGVVHECGHFISGPIDVPVSTGQQVANKHRDRVLPPGDTRLLYRVADHHWRFMELLSVELQLEVTAVPNGKMFYLGVRCGTDLQARRASVAIFKAVMGRPKLAARLRHDLAIWRVRQINGRLTLWWPAIELLPEWKH
jgi:hypothetical protein